MIQATYRLLGSPVTYKRLLYLFLVFPLSIVYFMVLMTLLAVGLSLAVVLIGIPILALAVLTWLGIARMERRLTMFLLGARVRPMSVPGPAPTSRWEWMLARLGDVVTWKALAYVFVEILLSVVPFVLLVCLLAAAVILVVVPLYWAAFIVHSVDPTALPGAFDAPGPTNSVLAFGVGLLMAFVCLWLLNGMGWAWARFAEVILGVDESRLRVAAAEAEAATQRERAESAEQKRRALLVNASHELRTPVAGISAHVESLLKPERQLDDETRRYLGVVQAETRRLGTLVEDVLALARADADELRLEMGPVDVGAVVERVTEALAPLARRERKLSLVHSVATDLPPAAADRDRLAQVLTNLVRNALNYTPDGGIVSVAARGAAPDRVIVEVSDTGIGIAPEDLEHVFDRFYRTDASRTRDSGGAGLGLAIVHDLVTAMGGTIVAESKVGEGSLFRIELKRTAG